MSNPRTTPGSSLGVESFVFRYAELRKLAETKTGTATLPVERPTLKALLDVVEAAHRANFDAPCEHCQGTDTDCPNVRLRASLQRIDFWRHA